MTKQQLLDQIKADIIKKNICPDLAKTATQLVFGDGNPEADIVFIGEAPGKNEDEQGIPFIGAAGKFLAEMLGSIHLKREQVYITNIVKYRPPNNRDPLPEEKQAFLPYLMAQLEVIQPLLVVTLGRHSGEAFVPGLKIGQDHASVKRIRVQDTASNMDGMHGDGEARNEAYTKYAEESTGAVDKADRHEQLSATRLSLVPNKRGSWYVMPLFHPAAALYNGGMRQTLIDDFALIPAILDKIRKEQ